MTGVSGRVFGPSATGCGTSTPNIRRLDDRAPRFEIDAQVDVHDINRRLATDGATRRVEPSEMLESFAPVDRGVALVAAASSPISIDRR